MLDIFRFTNPLDPLDFKCGQILNGVTKIEWIERYREPSEFKVTIPLDYNPREQAPIGTFVSHPDSVIPMRVENHELVHGPDGIPEVILSGRDAYVILDWRVIGAIDHWTGTPSSAPNEYMTERMLNGEYYWAFYEFYFPYTGTQRAETLLNDTLVWGGTDDNDEWPTVGGVYLVAHEYGRNYPELPTRLWRSDDKSLLKNVKDILETDNLGMRTERPNKITSPSGFASSDTTVFYVHGGEDRTREVVFSNSAGEIKSANFLWSDKDYRNTVYMKTSNESYMLKDSTVSGYDRRHHYVDYSDADSGISWNRLKGPIYYEDTSVEPPVASQQIRDSIQARCKEKALEELSKTTRTSLGEIEINAEASRYKHRVDYNVGDLVTVDYGYIDPEVKRVVEYVEILDENGFTEYPVLEAPRDKCFGYDTDT